MEPTQGKPMLLHACCGPCSLEPTRLLQEEGFAPVIYYENSNIWPPEEYGKRLDTLKTWAEGEGITVIEAPYDHQGWLESVSEGCDTADLAHAGEQRCICCYTWRLSCTAEYAKEHGFDAISTTLSVSPYQYTGDIESALANAGDANDLDAHFVDFREHYAEATRRSRELGMYRQNYCGCEFSYDEAAEERAARKAERESQRQTYLEEHAEELAAQEQARLENRREKQAYAAKQARKAQLKREYLEGHKG